MPMSAPRSKTILAPMHECDRQTERQMLSQQSLHLTKLHGHRVTLLNAADHLIHHLTSIDQRLPKRKQDATQKPLTTSATLSSCLTGYFQYFRLSKVPRGSLRKKESAAAAFFRGQQTFLVLNEQYQHIASHISNRNKNKSHLKLQKSQNVSLNCEITKL